MNNYAPGTLIAQIHDQSASARLAYSATLQTEIQCIIVCNTGTANGTFSIYHDDSSNGFSAGTALYFNEPLSGERSFTIRANEYGTGISIAKGGSLGINGSVTSAFTFSIYGTTQLAR